MNEEDLDALAEAFEGAEPLEDRERVTPPPPPASTGVKYDEDSETLAELEKLIDGDAPFDAFPFKEEYTEWAAEDAPHDATLRLSRGDIPFQAHLDLHGLTRDEARAALVAFLNDARKRGHSCVLVVHGRGKRSPGGDAVLRRAVHVWLRRGSIGKKVLAYATAPAVDGGGGATFVLLRNGD